MRFDPKAYMAQFARYICQTKAMVGEGQNFRNEVAHGVFSDRGFWIQLESPMDEFMGAVTADNPVFVDSDRVIGLVFATQLASELFLHKSLGNMELILLYEPVRSLETIEDSGVMCFRSPQEPGRVIVIGEFREGQVPLFVKFIIDPELALALGLPENIQRYIAVANIRPGSIQPHLMLYIPRQSQDYTKVVFH